MSIQLTCQLNSNETDTSPHRVKTNFYHTTCQVAILLALLAASSLAAKKVTAKQVQVALKRLPSSSSNQLTRLTTVHRESGIKGEGLRGESSGEDLHQEPLFMNKGLVGEFGFGTPPQRVTLLIQTAGADIWVLAAGYTCPNNSCPAHRTFDCDASSSCQPLNRTYANYYGGGREVHGDMVQDKIQVDSISVRSPFAKINELDGGDWSWEPWDGMFGLAYASLSRATPPTDNILDSMADQGLIQRRLAFFYMTNLYDGAGSEMVIGGMDLAKCYCNMTWLPVTRPRYWEIQLVKVYVAGRNNPSIVYYCTVNCVAIFDTSSLGIYGPRVQVTAINTQLGGVYAEDVGLWEVECAKVASLPRVMFVFSGDSKMGIDSKHYVLKDEGRCFLLFIPNPYSFTWFLGEAWFTAYCITLDKDDNQVGMARAKPGGST